MFVSGGMTISKSEWLILGLILSFGIVGLMGALGYPANATITASVTALCAVWWVSEAIPIPVTALLPLSLFPLLGVLTPEEVAGAYGHPLILFFLGGFIMSSAMEKSGAHRRLALGIVSAVGGSSPRRLVFGFMTASALLSMFISNTAALLMLLPIMLATVQGMSNDKLRIALLLGIAYAASIGGIGTPIGTPPNLLFMQALEQTTGEQISFVDWMGMALPIVIPMLLITGFWLTRGLGNTHDIRLPSVGAWTSPERRTLIIFSITACLWITRAAPFGGWSTLLDVPTANDAMIALLAVTVMFIVPDGANGKILDWEHARKIPWGMLLLFAGGISIAKAFDVSGLGLTIGTAIASFNLLPLPLLMIALCLAVTFLTELTSNTATAALLMPVLASAATASGVDPLLFMLPAVYAISFAFMLPVATPTNAVVYGTGYLTISKMAREGFVLNLAGVITIAGVLILTQSIGH